MKAVLAIIGKDSTGIIAKVSTCCAEHQVNIIEISQTVMNEYFTMIMLTDIDKLNISFQDFVDIMSDLGRKNGLEIHTMHEDIFNSMHNM